MRDHPKFSDWSQYPSDREDERKINRSRLKNAHDNNHPPSRRGALGKFGFLLSRNTYLGRWRRLRLLHEQKIAGYALGQLAQTIGATLGCASLDHQEPAIELGDKVMQRRTIGRSQLDLQPQRVWREPIPNPLIEP